MTAVDAWCPGAETASFSTSTISASESEGGDHDPDGLVVLCGAHHRAQHRGQLLIEGRVSTGLVFRHANGAPYGSVVGAHAAASFEEAFRALRSLGFREGESRAALTRVRTDPSSAHGNIEQVLRQALALLTANARIRSAVPAPAAQ